MAYDNQFHRGAHIVGVHPYTKNAWIWEQKTPKTPLIHHATLGSRVFGL